VAGSHVALLSWAAPARLAKAVQLSGNAAVRFDGMTTLRLLADNPDCHAALLSSPVIKVIVRACASTDKSDRELRLKALRAIAAMAETGLCLSYCASYPSFLPLLPISLTHKLQTARC